MTFKEIVLKYKHSITIILLFVIIENVSFIIAPTFFGKLPDSLIDHFYDHEKADYIYPLVIWIIVYLIIVVGGTFHRLFNGSIYSKMYANIAFFKERLPSVKVLLVIIFIGILFICVDVDKFTAGRIYAVVAYLWTFIASTDYLPEHMESLASVRDLNVRFTTDEKI
jgi:ABC-type multidrug transport system fused ATPase/permease subunit